MKGEFEKNQPYQRRLRLSFRGIMLAFALTAAAVVSIAVATWGSEKNRPMAFIKPAGVR